MKSSLWLRLRLLREEFLLEQRIRDTWKTWEQGGHSRLLTQAGWDAIRDRRLDALEARLVEIDEALGRRHLAPVAWNEVNWRGLRLPFRR